MRYSGEGTDSEERLATGVFTELALSSYLYELRFGLRIDGTFHDGLSATMILVDLDAARGTEVGAPSAKWYAQRMRGIVLPTRRPGYLGRSLDPTTIRFKPTWTCSVLPSTVMGALPL